MKKSLLIFFVFAAIYGTASAQSYAIITIAGTGVAGYNGDNIQATAAQLNTPYGIGVDAAGNTYTADYYSQRVRKRNAAGVITTIAGTGTAGFSGDGGQATAAQVSQPADVWPDAVTGNIYIADEVNDRVRKINTNGVITTIAGTGLHGYNGDNIQATAAALSWPFGVHTDAMGNIYIAEYGGSRVRKITLATGIITTIAGTGVSGYNGDNIQATAAQLGPPLKVYLDPAGNVYIADYNNRRIRKITVATGIITTVAGNGVSGYSGDGGQATAAELVWPFGVGVDAANNVYIADLSGDRIRKVNTSGVINTIAGTGVGGFNGDGSPATTKQINWPTQTCIDAAGNIYLSEYSGERDRELVNAVLPVTLSSFNAEYDQQNNAVLCRWEVSTQTDNKLFTIERSIDGITFTEVGTVSGAGTTSVTTDYTMQDEHPIAGISYYRLKQTDYDGHETTFSAVAISVNPSSGTVSLYPNPVSENATLAYYSTAIEPVTITIMDGLGRTVNMVNLNVQTGNNTINIGTSHLAKGIYFMRITGSAQSSFVKFIKD